MKFTWYRSCCRKIFIIALLLLHLDGFAQQEPVVVLIKGKVTDVQTNESLSGVSVGIKGTKKIVLTDENGNYSITAGSAATLVFSYVGNKSTEVTVGNQKVVNATLHKSTEELKDVVIAALGIKKERRALGYLVTEVKGAELKEARETNFVNNLEGKVAGVNVSNVATGPGGSANVVIRGISNITGSKQPLYVIDGIPMQNNTYRQTDMGGGYGGADGGDGTININPDDIENISVLKERVQQLLHYTVIAAARALFWLPQNPVKTARVQG